MSETSSQTSADPAQTTPQPSVTEGTPPQNTTTSTPTTQPSDTSKSLLNEGTKPEFPSGAPESYEPFIVPDGFTLDDAVATEADALFKESGLSQAQAQKLIDFYTAKTQEAFEQPVKVWKEQQEAWKVEVQNDPELKGKLANDGPIRITFAKMLDSLGDAKLASDFRDAMDYTGAGNNPAFIKAIYRLAQRLTEGTHVPGNKPSEHGQNPKGEAGRPSLAAAIYGPTGPRSERTGPAT